MSWQSDELELGRLSPSTFGHVVSGGTRGREGAYQLYPHIALLNDELLRSLQEQDAVLRGESEGGRFDRLIVSMPPRHGKSETISKYTPAWFLGARPERRVILTSYEASFAESWGRKARDLLEANGREFFGVEVAQGSKAAKAWDITGHDGGMNTAGAGGPITGKGAELFVIDDPIKNAEEAQSEVMREKVWEWWRSTARTRLQKGAVVILVMTRWHEDDLAGRLLAYDAELAEEEREGWRILDLPALAEPDPETGEHYDALERAEGEALCPELGFDERWATRTRAAVGSYWWAALYQCRPRPADGLLFKRQHFRYFEVELADDDEGEDLYVLEGDNGERRPVGISWCTHFLTVDGAASEKEMADYSVVSTWAVTPQRELLLVSVRRERFEDSRVGGMVREEHDTAIRRPVLIVVENTSSGPKIIKELSAAGLPVVSAEPDNDKVTRALLAVARYEQHHVFHRRGPGSEWRRDFEHELLGFPNVAHDDQVDTVSYAAIWLPKIPVGGARRRSSDEVRTPTMKGIRTKRF